MTGDELKFQLRVSGLTQAAAATRFGVDARTIRRWIAGERTIPSWVDELFRAWEKLVERGQTP